MTRRSARATRDRLIAGQGACPGSPALDAGAIARPRHSSDAGCCPGPSRQPTRRRSRLSNSRQARAPRSPFIPSTGGFTASPTGLSGLTTSTAVRMVDCGSGGTRSSRPCATYAPVLPRCSEAGSESTSATLGGASPASGTSSVASSALAFPWCSHPLICVHESHRGAPPLRLVPCWRVSHLRCLVEGRGRRRRVNTPREVSDPLAALIRRPSNPGPPESWVPAARNRLRGGAKQAHRVLGRDTHTEAYALRRLASKGAASADEREGAPPSRRRRPSFAESADRADNDRAMS